MMQKAEAQGLSFRSELALDGDALKAPIIDSYHSFIAPSAQSRMFGENGTHTNINETIARRLLNLMPSDAWDDEWGDVAAVANMRGAREFIAQVFEHSRV